MSDPSDDLVIAAETPVAISIVRITAEKQAFPIRYVGEVFGLPKPEADELIAGGFAEPYTSA